MPLRKRNNSANKCSKVDRHNHKKHDQENESIVQILEVVCSLHSQKNSNMNEQTYAIIQ